MKDRPRPRSITHLQPTTSPQMELSGQASSLLKSACGTVYPMSSTDASTTEPWTCASLGQLKRAQNDRLNFRRRPFRYWRQRRLVEGSLEMCAEDLSGVGDIPPVNAAMQGNRKSFLAQQVQRARCSDRNCE